MSTSAFILLGLVALGVILGDTSRYRYRRRYDYHQDVWGPWLATTIFVLILILWIWRDVLLH